MERPSHIILNPQSHFVSRRLPLLGLALCLQASVFWLFTHGLISQTIRHIPGLITVIPVPEKHELPLPPPPGPKIKIPGKITVVIPRFGTAPNERSIVNIEQKQAPSSQGTETPPVPDRAAISVGSTHTTPPYPPIARRIGAEGKVMLRLTISAEGRVTAAEIVKSSGRDDLDQTAQQWILAHWIYKPALHNGVAAVSQTLATMTFNLQNEH